MSDWRHPSRYRGFPNHIKKQARKHLAYQCANCGDNHKLELDHIRNRSANGTDTLTNAQWLCRPCHQAKTNTETRRGQTDRANRARHPNEKHPGLA